MRYLNTWDTRNVVGFSSIFDAALSFNQPIDRWQLSGATSLYSTFRLAESFNQP